VFTYLSYLCVTEELVGTLKAVLSWRLSAKFKSGSVTSSLSKLISSYVGVSVSKFSKQQFFALDWAESIGFKNTDKYLFEVLVYFLDSLEIWFWPVADWSLVEIGEF